MKTVLLVFVTMTNLFCHVTAGTLLNNIQLVGRSAKEVGGAIYPFYKEATNDNEKSSDPSTFDKVIGVVSTVIKYTSHPHPHEALEMYEKTQSERRKNMPPTTLKPPVTSDETCCGSTRIEFAIDLDKSCSDFDGVQNGGTYVFKKYCYAKICSDGSKKMGHYCGRGECNIFGCNCDGRCRPGDAVTSFRNKHNTDSETHVKEVIEVMTLQGSPLYWFQ